MEKSPKSPKSQQEDISSDIKSDTITYRLLFQDSIGWGYQIFEGRKMLIDQKHIPAIQGLRGFGSKQNAEIAARYIVDKIERGIFPPTLTQGELDSLNILN